MGRLEKGQEMVRGLVNTGRELILAVRGYTEIALHYGPVYLRVFTGKRQEKIEEVKPMDLGPLQRKKE